MIGTRLKRATSTLTLMALLISGHCQARETVSASAPGSMDLSTLLPPVRGLEFNDPWGDVPEKGPIAPEYAEEQRLALIAGALSWIGTPYRLGGYSKAGVDCSGFLGNILSQTFPDKAPFPRRSDGYALVGDEVTSIEPGDILLFAYEHAIYHVGLALSAATFIHAASEGTRTGVIISSLGEGNWGSRLFGVRRLRP